MRFISDDNKVFNTLEECKAHEEELKNSESEKKKQEEFAELKKRYDNLVNEIDGWEDDYYEFLDKYHISLRADNQVGKKEEKPNCKSECNGKCDKSKAAKSSSNRYTMDFTDLLDFLESYFN